MPPSLAPHRAGFTLAEVMVAIVVFTVGIMGLMATSMLVNRMVTHSRQTDQGSAFVDQLLERLRTTGCATPAGGSATRQVGGVTVDSVWWTFTARQALLGAANQVWSIGLTAKTLVGPRHWRTTRYETGVSCLL